MLKKIKDMVGRAYPGAKFVFKTTFFDHDDTVQVSVSSLVDTSLFYALGSGKTEAEAKDALFVAAVKALSEDKKKAEKELADHTASLTAKIERIGQAIGNPEGQ